jgi:hypothetical protein
MRFDDPRRNPFHDPEKRPSGWLLVLIAVGVSVLVTLLSWLLLYMRAVFNTQPLG